VNEIVTEVAMKTEFDRYMSGESKHEKTCKDTVSVILPVYNAEHTIKSMLEFIRNSWKGSWGALEIIVVDNGSKDRTSELAYTEADLVITQKRRNGIGVCLRDAMAKARGDYRLVIEPRRLEEICRAPFYLEYLKDGYDLVLGNRFASTKQNGFKGSVIAQAVKRFADERVAPGINDVRSGFTGFTRRSGRFLFSSSISKGINTNAEIIGLAKVNKMRIKEVALVDPDSQPVSETIRFATAAFLIAESIKTKTRLDKEIERSVALNIKS
jgi:glycosyltransferase involved in cell wall biosynthesis